mgnify:CR=1 FL=1
MKTVYLSVRLKNYENALALVGAPLAETPENADVLLLPGGGDMHPRFYGQALNGSEDLDEARDARELTLIDNFLCAGNLPRTASPQRLFWRHAASAHRGPQSN